MKKVLLIITAMCFIFTCTACAQKRKVNDQPVHVFNIYHYLGTWYEVARIDHSFERNMEFTQAVYTLQDDGTVHVENSGFKNGKFKKSIGIAKRPDPLAEPALMRVSFFRPFYSDYRVLMVDSDYRFALVSSKGPNYLWILSRERDIPDDVLNEILLEAGKRGFDISRLTWVTQSVDEAEFQ